MEERCSWGIVSDHPLVHTAMQDGLYYSPFHELSTAMSEGPSHPTVILFDFYHREDSRFDLRL